jgi:hypothetical protein
MKAARLLILFTVISVVLIASATLHYSASPQISVQITQMEIHFINQDAIAVIDYEVGFLTQLYILFFGTHHLNPYLQELFFDFYEYRIISVHSTTATVELLNVSRFEDIYYLHGSHRLGSEVGLLVLLFPDGHTMTFNNAVVTPNVFY